MSNFDEDFFKKLLKEEREECLKGPGLDLGLHEAFVQACQEYQEAYEGMIAAHQEMQQDAKLGKHSGHASGRSSRKSVKQKKGSSSSSGTTSGGGKELNGTDTTKQKLMSAAQVAVGGGSISAEDVQLLKEWNIKMEQALQKCTETAKPILEAIQLTDFDLEMSLLRTAILTRATPKGLSKFSNESDLNGQLIETLLNSKKIMKEMLLHGGPTGHNFGAAMKWFTQIMAKTTSQDRFHKVNKRLAMAAALEFATPKMEFDTSIEVSAVERFQHYQKAHRKGELDPSFSFFKTWEYRLAINSDAPNEQLQWGRDMLMTYAPHLCSIYDQRYRYCYAVKSDVGYREPSWTSSPRTYQQVLSGGGREGPRAWFGRFICQAFGIPVWGCKQPGNAALSRWTPEGWKLMFSLQRNDPILDWKISTWEGRSGRDFITEAKARSAVSEQDYYENVILLECLADACKEKIKTHDDLELVHPSRVWRSLALMQKKIFAEDRPCIFQRTGPVVVMTKLEQYMMNHPTNDVTEEELKQHPIEKDEKAGTITIPGIAFTSSNGPNLVKRLPSFDSDSGTQVHFMDGEGEATYEIPSDLAKSLLGDYKITAQVCTVHLEQQPLHIQIIQSSTKANDNDDNATPTEKKDDSSSSTSKTVVDMAIPYTVGKWELTEPVVLSGLGGKDSTIKLRMYRRKAEDCFGLAIKEFVLSPISKS